jgi:hypothetical protein
MFGILQAVRIPFVAAMAIAGLGMVTGCGSPQNFGLNPAAQSFGQVVTYNTQVDLMMVISTTSSMGKKQEQLASQFYPFINYLAKSQFDFHIAVTTTDMSANGAQGSFVGATPVLSKSTPNLQQIFVSNVSQGTSGSDLTRGLLAMQTALSPGLLSTKNAGFFRDSAMLAVVFMTDEDDESVNSTQSYIDFLDKLKPPFPYGARGWVANSIVVPSLDDQCKTYNSTSTGNLYASPGMRYMDLSSASGGSVESICGPDLIAASSDIKERISEMLTRYHIDRTADPLSIKVFEDGVSVPKDATNGWTFDVPSNTITFHGTAVPGANSKVQVAYQPLGIKS